MKAKNTKNNRTKKVKNKKNNKKNNLFLFFKKLDLKYKVIGIIVLFLVALGVIIPIIGDSFAAAEDLGGYSSACANCDASKGWNDGYIYINRARCPDNATVSNYKTTCSRMSYTKVTVSNSVSGCTSSGSNTCYNNLKGHNLTHNFSESSTTRIQVGSSGTSDDVGLNGNAGEDNTNPFVYTTLKILIPKGYYVWKNTVGYDTTHYDSSYLCRAFKDHTRNNNGIDTGTKVGPYAEETWWSGYLGIHIGAAGVINAVQTKGSGNIWYRNYESTNILFKPNTRKIVYNTTGSTSGTAMPTTDKYIYNDTNGSDTNTTLSPMTRTKPGWTFKGWSTSSTSTTITYADGATIYADTWPAETSNLELYAVWEATATMYYNSETTNGGFSAATKTQSCQAVSNSNSEDLRCLLTIPSGVRSSVGKYNSTYNGLTDDLSSMYYYRDYDNDYTNSSATQVTIEGNTTFYSIYSTPVKIYYPSSTSAATNKTVYRNEFFTSTSAMNTVLTAATPSTQGSSGTTTNATAGTLPSGYSLYGFSTSSNTGTRTYSTISDLVTTNVTNFYQIDNSTSAVACANATFYYSNSATGAKKSVSQAGTAGGSTTTLYTTTPSGAPTASTTSTSSTAGTMTAPTLSDEVAPYGTTSVGWSTGASTIGSTGSYACGGTYYKSYRKAVTNYYPSSTSAATSQSLYRNSYYGSGTSYTTVIASTNTGTSNFTPTVPSGYSLYGFGTSVNSRTRAYSTVDAFAKSTTTTSYQIDSKSDTQACANATFNYSNSSTGAKTSMSQTGTAGTGTRYAYPSSTSAATTVYVATTQPSMSAPSSPTGEVAPYGTTALGWSGVNSMDTTDSYACGGTYYRNYQKAVTNYYPSSTTATSSQGLYRNSFLPSTTATTYSTVIASTNTGLTNFTPTVPSGYSFYGFGTSVNSRTSSYGSVDALAKSTTTTSYQIDDKTNNITFHFNSNTTSGSFTDATATSNANQYLYPASTSTATTSNDTTTTVPSIVSSSVGKYNSAYKGISSSSSSIASSNIVTTFTGGQTYYAYYQTPLTNYYYGSSYTNRNLYRNEYYSSASAMNSVLSTDQYGMSNYSTATGPGSSVWKCIRTTQNANCSTDYHYDTVAAAATAPAANLTSNSSKIYTVYQFNTTYEKGSNVSAIGATNGNCLVTTSDTSCSVTLPSITPNTGYVSVGWNTSSGASTGTNAGATYNVSSNNLKLYANAVDSSKPVCSITSTNNVTASQTSTLNCTDNVGVVKYYWGTDSNPSDSSFTTITSTTNMTIDKSVNTDGTYYLIAKDTDGNSSTVVSKTFYKTTLHMTNGTVNPTSVITMSGNSFNLPTPTPNDNYGLEGHWYTNSGMTTGAKAYGASYTPSSSTILYSSAVLNSFTPGIAMSIPGAKSIYKNGDEITYNIVVTNNESFTINNVVVEDPNATINSGSGYTVSNNKATITTIPAGGSVTIIAKKTIGASDVNSFVNTATITAATSADGTFSGSPSDSKTVTIQSLIKITNIVEGNLAEPDDYFKVNISISGAVSGDTYTISGQSYSGSDKKTTYTVGSENYIYIKHGETVTIGSGSSDAKIGTGVTYSIQESTNSYETYINGSSSNNKSSGDLSTSTTSNTNTINIKNVKGAPVETGVFVRYLPYILLFIIIGGIGFIIFKLNNKKR